MSGACAVRDADPVENPTAGSPSTWKKNRMTPLEAAALAVLVGYTIYAQARVHEVPEHERYIAPFVYALIGLAAGGISIPDDALSVSTLTAGILASVAVGLARGRVCHVWMAPDGSVHSQGTMLTVSLSLGLVAAALGLNPYRDLLHIATGYNPFSAVLWGMAIMTAVAAALVRSRALTLLYAISQIELDAEAAARWAAPTAR
jgi:hypothetical protein